jgi:hypothetical protein
MTKGASMLNVVSRSKLYRVVTGSRVPRLALAATAALVAGAASAGAASAKSETLHFYQVGGRAQFYNAAGKKIDLNPPATLPKPGDSFDEVDVDYAGTPKHHAVHWTATDHLTCTFTNHDTGLCNSQVAIGGSLLLSNNFTMTFGPSNAPEPINEATGVFSGMHGTLVDADLPKSNNATLVIHLS